MKKFSSIHGCAEAYIADVYSGAWVVKGVKVKQKQSLC